MSYEEVVEKIKQGSNLSIEQINQKVKDRVDMLSGLVSKEGAAYIIANELGIKLVDLSGESIKISNISNGLRNIHLVSKVAKMYDKREFQKSGGALGKLRSFVIADDTGTIRAVFWNEKADLLDDVEEGDIVDMKPLNVRLNNNNLELHSTNNLELVINPEGVSIENVKEYQSNFSSKPKNNYERVLIDKIDESKVGTYVKFSGVIVNVFSPATFYLCPHCRHKVSEKNGSYYCDEHNLVKPEENYVCSVLFDDGTAVIRVALWKTQIDQIGMDNLESLTGKVKMVGGKVNKNYQTEKPEISASFLGDPNLDEELEFYEKLK